MSAQGTILARVYTSGAQLPLGDVPVRFSQVFSDGRRQQLAVLYTNASGLTPALSINTPDRADSLRPGAALQPYALVDIRAEAPGYKPVEASAIQVFPGVETIQLLQLIPLPDGDSGTVIYQPEPPQNL